MPKIHLRQPGFNYSACGSFNKNKKIKDLKKQEIQDIFIKVNYFSWRNPKYDDYQKGLSSMVYNFFN